MFLWDKSWEIQKNGGSDNKGKIWETNGRELIEILREYNKNNYITIFQGLV